MLDLTRVKEQVRLDDQDTSEDQLLELYLGAARRSVEAYLCRPVLWEDPLPDPVPEDALPLTEDLALAALLLVGHWYDKREACSEDSPRTIPFGFRHLLDPHRLIPL